MSNSENMPARATTSARARRPILRTFAAVVVMALSIGLSATPILASGGVAPDAPTITGITVGRNAVSVAFAPNSDGGDPITGYTVTCDSSDGGASQSTTDVGSPLTVNALTNGNTYSCTVVATNSDGTSLASDPSDDFLAITVPDAPTITGVTRGTNSAIVAFSANGDGGDSILFYKVTCTSSSGGTTRAKTGVGSPITVTSLSNGRTYSCALVATNSVGDSAASTASVSFVAVTNPAAPTITGVTRGNNAGIVAVTPNSTGGSAITGYSATCTSSDGGTTQSASNAASPVTVASLTNGSTYTCTAIATNAFGNSVASAASSSFVVAATPDAPTLTAITRGAGTVGVAFTPNATGGSGITGFTATCTSSDGGATQSASNATSPVTVGSLTIGKTYTCTVLAANAVGNGTASTASASFLAATVPDAPSITGVTRGSNSAVVAFTANGDGSDPITGYTATCTSSDGGTTRSASNATTPVTVTSLTNTKTYTCTAVATNGFGDSVASVASTSFVAATVPDAPTLTSIDLGLNSVTVGFTANGSGGSAITGYTVTCASSDGGTTQTGTDTTSPITVTSLSNSKTYTCAVVATNATGDSSPSDASAPFVAATVPAAPTITTVDLGSNAVTVGVTPNANGGDTISGYTVTCVSSDGGTTESGSNATSPVTVTALTNGSTYACTAVATNGIGDSAASTASSDFVAVGLAAAPTITSVDLDRNAVIVSFTPNADGGDAVISFTVTCVSSDGGTTRSATNATSPVTVSALTNGNTYTCTVLATNSFGDSAASDPTSSFVAGNAPAAPSIAGVTRGSNSAIVAFTANGDGGDPITQYRVTCKSSNGGISRSRTGVSSPITITSLSNSRTYTCTVIASNTIADSLASAASSSFVAATYPVAPTVTGVTRGHNTAIVTFTAGGNGGSAITGYTVTCGSSDGGTTQAVSGASSPITVTSLTNANTYTCTAVATNAVGDSAASAASSSFVAATNPPAPSISGVTLGNNSAAVAFTANGNSGDTITGYTVTCTSSDGGTTRAASGASSPIAVASLSNSKSYTCTVIATNSFGDSGASSASTSFVAGTVPVAPTVTGVTRGNNTAVVAFIANGSGGSAITGFTATCTSSDGGTTQAVSGASSPLTVVSLTNGNTYTCAVVATNATGNSAASTASASFVAATTPLAPTISGVTRGNNSAIVAFTSGGDSGDAITAYTTTCTSSNGGATQTTSGATSPVTVATLTNGKTYTCTVLATNSFGNSPLSAASTSFVVATSPSAPTITGITHTAGSAVVTFTAGATGGSVITGFTVTCTSTNGGTTRSVTSTHSPITVTLLTAGKQYTCRATAMNAVGTSVVSNPFSFTD